MMRLTKQDFTCIYFKEILNQLNLLCLCLYLQQIKSYELMCRIIGYDHSLGLKEFLAQLNLLYI
jgi:hypothetical protein